ncbi:hypothetical protein [Parvicella tangerina]|uniref:Uncharacterized protein n=1 Tax=Parvicella tangerina TaxID=2829795 RepID=A0A916NHJ0_9FLAO|nr:hypothetical protein [Parvicella tangerina]CAG5083156.1 hypothetical protein CRYO30217_02105 [Parvicella tangerina]
MQTIEPFFHWRDYYRVEDDQRSPFFGFEHSEFEYSNAIYDHYIHPQWDSIESETLFVKVLYANYEEGYAFVELLGEWNDLLYNDIMFLKQNLLELMMDEGINKFILIGRNVLNFHAGDDDYYQELSEDLDGGWLIGVQFPQHVKEEFNDNGLGSYLLFLPEFDELNDSWTVKKPEVAYAKIRSIFLN